MATRSPASYPKLDKLMIASIMIIVIVSNSMISAQARYMPGLQDHMQRRQDYEGDDDPDGDQDASASYQNQDENGGPASDGYEDNEPDGPYGETPREEEGQADLERFFDDHLGASEKEGMDKENLPSNLIPMVAYPSEDRSNQHQDHASASSQAHVSRSKYSPSLNEKIGESLPVRSYTRYVRLPENKLIITRQITSDPNGGFRPSRKIVTVPQYANYDELEQTSADRKLNPEEILAMNSSEIVRTEDDDFDKVYITNLKNRKFKIPDLGGYDPEEDFKYASRDIERLDRPVIDNSRRQDNQDTLTTNKDITFNDPDEDTLYNDASELDEVAFGPDDTDLETEMRDQGYDRPGKAGLSQPIQGEESENRQDEVKSKPPPPIKRHDGFEDDDEGSWVNDGADDMEIPSQSHQNAVLERAAKQEAAAKKAAEDEAIQAEAEAEQDPNNQVTSSIGQDESPHSSSDEEFSQRMPNAAYLGNDLKMDDTDYRA